MCIFKNIHVVLGWVGTFFYLLAYFLLSINKLKSNQKLYHVLNIIGAIGLTIHAFWYEDLPNVVVNTAWGLVAAFAIIVIIRRKPN